MREREEGPRTYFKALRLIVPEKAEQLGFPAEGPVFVSPNIDAADQCIICETVYTPLVYQVGLVVRSQHFHQGGGIGGIYHIDDRLPFNFTYIISSHPWIAMLKPFGRRGDWRSEAVEVQSMKALCVDNRCRLELNEGVVISFPAPTRPDELFPLCGIDQHPWVTFRETVEVNPNGRWYSARFDVREICRPPRPVFKFRITPDGRVVFGNLR